MAKETGGSSVRYDDANLTLKGKVLYFDNNWISLANVTRIIARENKPDGRKMTSGTMKILLSIAAIGGAVWAWDENMDYFCYGLAAFAAIMMIWGIAQIISAARRSLGLVICMNDGSDFYFSSRDVSYLRSVADTLGAALQCDAAYNVNFDMSSSSTTLVTGNTANNNVNYGTNYGNVGSGGTAYSAYGSQSAAGYSAPTAGYTSYPYGTYGQQFYNGQTAGRQ